MSNDADLSFFVSVCYSTKENVFCLKNEDGNESGGQYVSTTNHRTKLLGVLLITELKSLIHGLKQNLTKLQ